MRSLAAVLVGTVAGLGGALVTTPTSLGGGAGRRPGGSTQARGLQMMSSPPAPSVGATVGAAARDGAQVARDGAQVARDLGGGLVRRAARSPGPFAPAALRLVQGHITVALWLAATAATLGNAEARARLAQRWRKDPMNHGVVTPLSAAFVGWLTNWVGVEMLFSPLHWVGIPPPPIFGLNQRLARVPLPSGEMSPFGWLIGWQGIVPAKAPRMAKDLVRVVASKLVSVDETLHRLSVDAVARTIVPVVPGLAHSTLNGLVEPRQPWLVRPLRSIIWGTAEAARAALSPEHAEIVKAHTLELARGVARDVRRFGGSCLDLEGLCVRGLTGPNVADLVALFKRVGQVELRLLVNSGLSVGLALGIVQSIFHLCLAPKYGGETEDRPQRLWVSLVGSGVVGCVTNWIALLWIFKPIEPTKVLFGLVTLQGCFLKRQKEVSADFAKFFVENILTSRNMLDDALFTGVNSHKFRPLLRRRLSRFTLGTTQCLAPGAEAVGANGALLDSATEALRRQLPAHLPAGLYEYADEAFGLERTIATKMAAMPSRDFERLLHPIFEEDELTLIAVGGALGILAAYVQTLVSDPTFRGTVKRRGAALRDGLKKAARRLRTGPGKSNGAVAS